MKIRAVPAMPLSKVHLQNGRSSKIFIIIIIKTSCLGEDPSPGAPLVYLLRLRKLLLNALLLTILFRALSPRDQAKSTQEDLSWPPPVLNSSSAPLHTVFFSPTPPPPECFNLLKLCRKGERTSMIIKILLQKLRMGARTLGGLMSNVWSLLIPLAFVSWPDRVDGRVRSRRDKFIHSFSSSPLPFTLSRSSQSATFLPAPGDPAPGSEGGR